MANITIQKLKRNGWSEDSPQEMIEESLLEYSNGMKDDDNELTTWEEWRMEGKIVKRRCHVHLKKGLTVKMELSSG